jgi:hypothetical protein
MIDVCCMHIANGLWWQAVIFLPVSAKDVT